MAVGAWLKVSLFRVSLLRRGECSIATESGAGAVHRFDTEMVRSVGVQAADVRTDISEGVPVLNLLGGSVAVAGCRAVMERNSRGQPVRIKGAMKRG